MPDGPDRHPMPGTGAHPISFCPQPTIPLFTYCSTRAHRFCHHYQLPIRIEVCTCTSRVVVGSVGSVGAVASCSPRVVVVVDHNVVQRRHGHHIEIFQFFSMLVSTLQPTGRSRTKVVLPRVRFQRVFTGVCIVRVQLSQRDTASITPQSFVRR